MNDLIRTGKKVFTTGVVVTTIAWSMGLAALVVPLTAQAATLQAGDLIKASRPAVYYYGADGKRYVFPNEKTYKTWYADFSTVKKITDDELAAVAIGGNATYKPGVKMVKIDTDPKVYAVGAKGTLKWIKTEALAKELYGDTWAKSVQDVPDAFFTNYTIGTEVAAAADYDKAAVSAAATSIDVDKGLAAGTVTPVTPVAGAVTVDKTVDQPAAATIVASDTSGNGAQGMIDVFKLSFTASADADATVTSIVLKRGGVSADTDISNMYLYDGSTKVYGSPSISSTKITFSKSAGLFTVTKGTSKIVMAKLDLKDATSAGKTINFSVEAASSVTLSSGTVSGTFPITSNTFTTASVSDLGKLTWTSSTPSSAATVDPGTTNFEIWRITLANTNQDIELRKLVVTIVGSISVGDLQNFSLWVGATQIGSTIVDMASDKSITFDLSSSPYLITKGQTKILSMKTDVVGGTNRTFRATIQASSDIVTFDKGYSVYLKANSTDSFTVIEPNSSGTAVNYTINTGTLTQTLASDSPTGNIADGTTSVTLAKFNWKANGEDMKIANLSVSSTSNDRAGVLSNVRLLVDGSQVGTTITSLTADGLTTNTAIDDWGTFGNNFIIKGGKTASVKVVADTTHSTVAAADTFYVQLVAGSSNAQGTVSLSSISTVAQTANTLTVQSGTVSVVKNPSFGDQSASTPTGPLNATQIKVASLVITAGSGEGVDVTQVVLADNGTTYCIGDHLQNLTLKSAAGVQLGTTYANPSATCTTANTYTFNISPAVYIAAGAQYVVNVFADLKAALSTASVLIEVDAITASGHDSGTSASLATGQDKALQINYIASAGNMTVAVDADTPVALNYLLGSVDQTIAKFKIAASSTEAVNITQLVISAKLPTAATTGTWNNIRLYDDSTGLQIGTAVAGFSSNSTNGTSTYEHAIFPSLTLQIPKGISKVISVKADAATYEDVGLTTTGQTIEIAMLGSYYGSSGNNPVTVTGASSGSSLTAVIMSSGNINTYPAKAGAYAATTTLYRAKLSVAWASDTPSGAASPGAAQTVAKFVISNLANAGVYVATVNFVDFDISTTISNSADRTLTIYKDSLATTALGSTSWVAAGNQNFGNTAFLDASMTNVDISSGASKTFYVTLDTTNAVSTKTLSIRIGSNDITWTDGITSSLTVMGADLPLIYKTFTY